MYDLSGKTALVTGAAKRLGNAISVGLAKQGANVVVHYDRSEKEARVLQQEIAGLGVESWMVKAEFKDSESCEKTIKQAHELSGGIDILINNASTFSVSDVDKVKLEDIDAALFTNAWAPFELTRYFEKTNSGKIVNILDTRVSGYDFDHFAYYLSKKLLELLTKSLALKLAPNVTVNGVAPGLILPPEGKDVSYLEQRKDSVPLKRYGSAENIVQAVIFLLKNDYVTGQVVFVDGGKHLVQTLEGI